VTSRGWLLFTLSSVIWGVPYLFIKVAVDAGVPPGFIAWARVALAAVLLLPVALHRGALRGLRARAVRPVAWRHPGRCTWRRSAVSSCWRPWVWRRRRKNAR